MPVHFVLARYLPGFEEYGDLYEAIKTGKKTSEYRDATPYWAKRLLNNQGLQEYNQILENNKDNHIPTCVRYRFDLSELKHTEATFRVGYTQGPTLHATIREIHWKPTEEQFEVCIEDVRETP